MWRVSLTEGCPRLVDPDGAKERVNGTKFDSFAAPRSYAVGIPRDCWQRDHYDAWRRSLGAAGGLRNVPLYRLGCQGATQPFQSTAFKACFCWLVRAM